MVCSEYPVISLLLNGVLSLEILSFGFKWCCDWSEVILFSFVFRKPHENLTALNGSGKACLKSLHGLTYYCPARTSAILTLNQESEPCLHAAFKRPAKNIKSRRDHDTISGLTDKLKPSLRAPNKTVSSHLMSLRGLTYYCLSRKSAFLHYSTVLCFPCLFKVAEVHCKKTIL